MTTHSIPVAATMGDRPKMNVQGTIRHPKVSKNVVEILGWPTDMISIDFSVSESEHHADDETTMPAHTTLVFIPGNPGCCAWYQPILFDLVTGLGPGFRARLVSYAGHNPYNPQHSNVEQQRATKDAAIVWTVDGQIRHKEAFVDKYCCTSSDDDDDDDDHQQQLIFLSHSIGSHMVERLLMQRTDILERTGCVIHMMPFIRMNAPHHFDQVKLDFGAANPNLLIGFGRTAMEVLFQKFYSLESLDALLDNLKVYEDADGRNLAAHLLRQPHYARNFFELGTEEIRDVPFALDGTAMRQISRHCPLIMLYCADDQWAPYEHVPEIQRYHNENSSSKYPISIHYFPSHKHDFVSVDAMVPPVAQCCLQAIRQTLLRESTAIRSRL